MKRYVADFETTTDPLDCRVWGYGMYSIDADKSKVGNSIESFFSQLQRLKSGSIVYFHNLKFDGDFLLYYLKDHGFEHTTEFKLEPYEFTTLIDGMGNWYSVKIKFKYGQVTIYDSYKIIPLSVDKMSKAFGIKQMKGDIDYEKFRPVGHQLTPKEIKYINNDVVIVGKSLKYFFDQGLNKITQASNAFSDFETVVGKDRFRDLFPLFNSMLDKQIRASYKGGFTYVNPKYQGIDIGIGRVYDVNSLYPWIMSYKELPYGEPVYFEGEYVKDERYSLYVINIRCQFEIKENHIPTIQIKENMRFNEREYLTSSNDEFVNLCLTSVDFELFKKHYNIYNLEYFHGWKFKSTNTLFKEYIDKWKAIKIQATIENNEGLRNIAKLMLNALYGKFGLNPEVKSKIPIFDDDEEIIKFDTVEEEPRETIYIPVATFVTSYARETTITACQENYDRFMYGDTDSMHLIGDEPPIGVEVDSNKFGAWDHEDTFTKARYLKAKCYIEEIDNEIKVTVAGLPAKSHDQVTFDNFKVGLEIKGKLKAKRVKGGTVLTKTTHNIKI